MTNRPPTLSEMQHTLSLDENAIELIAMEIDDIESVLKHYGIKGMRWGIRRSDAKLGRSSLKNEEGEEVGGIRAKSKAAADKLRSMKYGETLVIDTVDSGPKVLVKQKDGSFKEATLSADAQSVLRTINKEPSEMSTREINEATKRAKAVEEYNKIFNPDLDPNAQLRARVEAMELQSKYSAMQAKMNPSASQRVGGFVKNLSPVFDTFQKVDKLLDNSVSKHLTKEVNKLFNAANEGKKNPKAEEVPKPKDDSRKKKKKQQDFVYDISSFGNEGSLRDVGAGIGRGR